MTYLKKKKGIDEMITFNCVNGRTIMEYNVIV